MISSGWSASSLARWVCSGNKQRKGAEPEGCTSGPPKPPAVCPGAGGTVGAGFGGSWNEWQDQLSHQLCSCVDGCSELFPALLWSTEAAHSA